MNLKRYRHHFHIMPPVGWLNDPNGSCFFNGLYHIFFQYSPDTPLGGKKYWGHYVSENLTDWNFKGEPLAPDTEFDCDGVYSGCAFIDDGSMELFYTGNVKHPGNFDYINEGRGHNVLYVNSPDGVAFEKKIPLLLNKDYPAELSCHVRDPKVWKKNGAYYMLLGARTRDSKAALLLFSSSDKKKWNFARLFKPADDFGYMLECPDYFALSDKFVIAACPQGIPLSDKKFQNVYHSGYVLLDKDCLLASSDEELNSVFDKSRFVEWDTGFDFYAPQTFLAKDGRRLLVGWAGVPDAPYGNDPAVEAGWQHSLTLVRELTLKNGKILQNPVRELESLRGAAVAIQKNSVKLDSYCFDSEFEFDSPSVAKIRCNEDFSISFENITLSLEFLNETGCGRKIRRTELETLKSIRLIVDESLIEIYVNNGEKVFTSRYYPVEETGALLSFDGVKSAAVWNMEVQNEHIVCYR